MQLFAISQLQINIFQKFKLVTLSTHQEQHFYHKIKDVTLIATKRSETWYTAFIHADMHTALHSLIHHVQEQTLSWTQKIVKAALFLSLD